MDSTFDPTPDAFDSVLEGQPIQDWSVIDRTEQDIEAAGGFAKTLAPLPPVHTSLDLELSPALFSTGYATRYVDVTLNRTAQRVTLKLLTESLKARNEKLGDGIPISRPEQAVQWLLEQIAIRLPQPTLDALMERVD